MEKSNYYYILEMVSILDAKCYIWSCAILTDNIFDAIQKAKEYQFDFFKLKEAYPWRVTVALPDELEFQEDSKDDLLMIEETDDIVYVNRLVWDIQRDEDIPFETPCGIIIDGEKVDEKDGLFNCFFLDIYNDNKKIILCVENSIIKSIFYMICEIIALNIDKIEFMLCKKHYDEGENIIFQKNNLLSKNYLEILEKYVNPFFGNGLVDIKVYFQNNDDILQLTNHKTLIVKLTDENILEEVLSRIKKIKLVESHKEISVESVPHYHYGNNGLENFEKLLVFATNELRLNRNNFET